MFHAPGYVGKKETATAHPAEVNIHQGNNQPEPRRCGKYIGCFNHRRDMGDDNGEGRISKPGEWIILRTSRGPTVYLPFVLGARCLVLMLRDIGAWSLCSLINNRPAGKIHSGSTLTGIQENDKPIERTSEEGVMYTGYENR